METDAHQLHDPGYGFMLLGNRSFSLIGASKDPRSELRGIQKTHYASSSYCLL